MKQPSKNYRWFVVVVFFLFMLFHQSDKLLIGSLTQRIIDTFHITYTQMGAVNTGALIVGAICYPIWGLLNDRYSRAKLLSLASLIWGVTTWFGAIAPSYPLFVAARSSTGIDDSSYPGLYSLIADYFPPAMRGKIYGLLSLSSPLGYLIGMILALVLGGVIGWRAVFYITGSLGVILSVVIFFGVKEAPRGGCEPELEGVEQTGQYKFEWKIARDLFKKKSLLLLYAQGFFGVFPWNVITYWFFVYLEKERGYTEDNILVTMVPAILMLAAGYPIGGALGDWLYKKTPRGRVIVSTFGVIMGAVLFSLTITIPVANQTLFLFMLAISALFIPFASANVLATVYDVTLPEVRSTANAVSSFIESAGSAAAPLIAGIIADQTSLKDAILLICIAAWLICFIFFLLTTYYLPRDIKTLHEQLKERAKLEKAQQTDLPGVLQGEKI